MTVAVPTSRRVGWAAASRRGCFTSRLATVSVSPSNSVGLANSRTSTPVAFSFSVSFCPSTGEWVKSSRSFPSAVFPFPVP